jgi:hypothetical protein
MRPTAGAAKAVGRRGAVLRTDVIYAVGCSSGPGQRAVVVGHTPTAAQAFELTLMLVCEQLGAAVVAAGGEAIGEAIGEATQDLVAEGPQAYGWWTEVAGYEIWYGPVTAALPEGMAVGEMALLATLADSPLGLVAAC